MKELDSVLKSIKNKTLQPFYFFHGAEPYFMDIAVKAFENEVLAEDEKDFGQTVIYGKDTTYQEILALAQQFPMFGELNLIIVKEAQDLRLAEEERTALENYIENPVATTVLVFAHKHKKLLGTTKFAKSLQKKGWLYLSEPIKDDQLPAWIANECKNLNIKIAPNISRLLAEYLGNDLSRISNELNKLKIFLKEDDVLDEKLVEKHIGISKEYNIFELQKALTEKNADKAFKITYYMGKNMKNNPMVMIVGVLYTYFSKLIIYQVMQGENPQNIASEMGMSPYFLKEYAESARLFNLKHSTRVISILREFDMKSKGLGANQTPDGELLKEMVFKILNIHQTKMRA